MRKSILSTAVVLACLIWVFLVRGHPRQGRLSLTSITLPPSIQSSWLPDEALQWHEYKDKSGPTYSGSPSWKSYMTFSWKKSQTIWCRGRYQEYLEL